MTASVDARPHFDAIPDEILALLSIEYLHRADAFAFYKTCRRFRALLDCDALWRRVVAVRWRLDAEAVKDELMGGEVPCGAREIRAAFPTLRGCRMNRVASERECSAVRVLGLALRFAATCRFPALESIARSVPGVARDVATIENIICCYVAIHDVVPSGVADTLGFGLVSSGITSSTFRYDVWPLLSTGIVVARDTGVTFYTAVRIITRDPDSCDLLWRHRTAFKHRIGTIPAALMQVDALTVRQAHEKLARCTASFDRLAQRHECSRDIVVNEVYMIALDRMRRGLPGLATDPYRFGTETEVFFAVVAAQLRGENTTEEFLTAIPKMARESGDSFLACVDRWRPQKKARLL